MNRFSRVSAEWKEAVFPDGPFQIKVLVVADGQLNFLEPDDLSLSMFCNALRESALPWENLEVHTGHRHPDPAKTGASIPNFKFDTNVDGKPRLHIDRYDEVWLFGYAGQNEKLSASELKAITEFMNTGGGVFATGDHEDLGYALCGEVPRVRRMRRWRFHNTPEKYRAPSRNASSRIDTLRVGSDLLFNSDDEEDAFPQEIRPRFFVNETRTATGPHELLASGQSAITTLPDHMHEGECVSPEEIKTAARDEEVRKEFPPRCNGDGVWPQVVAIATSAGGTFVPGDRIVPADPRSYIVISAYDGHLVEVKDEHGVSKLGRIVVDASFHHFVNYNLRGFEHNEPKKDYKLFIDYFRNILLFLLPPKTQYLYFLNLLRALRFTLPLKEDLNGLSPDKWEDVIFAGTVTKKVISNDFSPAHARRCALAMISDIKPNLRTYIEDMIDLWQRDHREEYSLFFLNSDAVLIVLLGQAILDITEKLPENPFEVSHALKKLETEGMPFRSLMAKRMGHRVTELQKRIGLLGEHLKVFSEIY